MSAKTVLVVDDEAPVRMAAAEALERAGFQVLQAADGKEALERVAEGGCDLVVLDVIMPEVGGWDVLRALRKDEATQELPVIMMTILDSDESVTTGWRMGADYYLTKPFSARDLVDIV
ncbi:MAG: PleD family two-component system response regulator, partial [Armatimonadota bacterium]